MRQDSFGDDILEFSPDSTDSLQPEIDTENVDEFIKELRYATQALPERINIDAQNVERGLAKLVLTLIEFIRRLLEKQAINRMEGGNLSPEQIENLGLALMKLEEKMEVLKKQFGLADEDLNIDLGPLGRVLWGGPVAEAGGPRLWWGEVF